MDGENWKEAIFLKRVSLKLMTFVIAFNSFGAFNIKVKIGDAKKKVEISGQNITRNIVPLKSRKSFKGRKKFKFNCDDLGSNYKRRESLHLASLSSKTGLVTYDNKKYIGNIHIITSENTDSCDVINEIGIDQYISSLLSKEMNSSWPIEALKAQAVAARTYALNRIKKTETIHYHLENSEKHQVNGDFFDVTMKTLRAAKQTAGYVLKNKKGELVPAFFHASCGGRTLKPNEVWTNNVHGYHRGVNCGHCKTKKNWQKSISKGRFRNFLSWLKKNDLVRFKSINKRIYILRDNPEKKYLRVKLGSRIHKIRKSYLRRYFGRVDFSSNNFYMADSGANEFTFVGKGRGHGVGMCQVGAKSLAQRGWSYRKILAHYFPDLEIKKVY